MSSVHRFPAFEIDEDKREVRAGGQTLTLQPRVFDLLVYLARHRERVVPKDELLDAVWPGVVVTDGSLQRAVSLARAALVEAGTHTAIRTYSRQGYRMCVDTVAGGASAPADVVPKQDVRFLRSRDETTIAYSVSGAGYPLIKVANWMSHLEYDHQSPVWRHWWRALSERYQLVRYDERGCGLSERNVSDYSLDAWVADLEAVADQVALPRFALLGISQGAAVAIAYAVKHPERVSHLVLYGGFIQGRMKRPRTAQQTKEAIMLLRLVRLGWGGGNPAFSRIFASLFIPDGTAEQLKSFVELQRVSCSPENAAHFMRAFGSIDVVDLAPRVTAPTLVLHARDDQEIPLDQARLIASLIPNARLALLEGNNHILAENEPAWPRFLEEIDAFLA